jgi:tRNA (guanine-N7-)-methyltransferase
MPRKKLVKFLEIRTMPNVVELYKPIYKSIKGKWSQFFGNSNPVALELGCGYGEYTTGLAKEFANNNYVGIDIKSDRLWAGANFATVNKLDNVAFLQTEIYNLQSFFEAREVSQIWITFPDPQLEKPRKRLTSKLYLEIYKKFLKPHGLIHLKTDSDLFFDFTLQTLEELEIQPIDLTTDLYNSPLQNIHQGIKTGFEKVYLHRGKKIKYLSFRIN